MIELSKAEFAVMEALWQNYPAKATDIIARLSKDTKWHEKTIKTLDEDLQYDYGVELENLP